jgi:threonine dehydratase
MNNLSFQDIVKARDRISDHINQTKIVSSHTLNKELNNKIFFKLENLQKTGSFKARGAFNHLLILKEQGLLPSKVVAVTSGNHGTAVSYICAKLGIESLIYTSNITPDFKIKAMKNFGAQIVITQKRSEANQLAEEKVKEGYHFIHPSSDDLVIAGQGTLFLESVEQVGEFDSAFAACGGGGLVSGIYIASQKYPSKTKIFAVEPDLANDALLSVKNNKIFSFKDSPQTIADGARTLAISENTFGYLKQINAILSVSEEEINHWTNRLNDILESKIEPTAAMSMAGCKKWISDNDIKDEKILVVISGGNI